MKVDDAERKCAEPPRVLPSAVILEAPPLATISITILVSPDGCRYTVIAGSFAKTFAASDSLNQR